MTSLRARLLLILVAAATLLLGVTAAWVRASAHREVDQLFDAQLVETARSMLAQYAHDYDELDDAGRAEKRRHTDKHGPREQDDEDENRHAPAAPYEQELQLLVRDPGGAVLYATPGAPAADWGPPEAGFQDTGASAWRVYSLASGREGLWVTVGQRHAARARLASAIASRLLLPLFVLVPAMALLIWFGLGAGLRPLRALASSVALRTPDRLAPIDTVVPSEVRPLVEELNGLLARLQSALAAERRFTADAAHELRTPLAALKTHAQVGLAAAGDEERRRALTNVSLGADRAAHLVEQLLTLARLEPGLESRPAQRVDLRALAAQAVGEEAARAADADVGLAPGSPVASVGDPVLLGVMLRNLIDNAVRYGGRAGKVDVAVREADREAILEVADSGPGIPPPERSRVFDRFHRGLGQDAPGSGLGLSIVRRIVELHGGSIELGEGSGGRGLLVRVRLPAAA